MDERPQFFSIENCTNFTTTQLLSLNLSISITGGLCFLLSSSIILLLLFNKAYSSLLQRLFLYLMVATALRHLSLFSLIEHYFYYAGQNEVCIVVAYFNHWMVAMTLFFTIGMLLYLFCMVSCTKGLTVQASKDNPRVSVYHSICDSIIRVCFRAILQGDLWASWGMVLDYITQPDLSENEIWLARTGD